MTSFTPAELKATLQVLDQEHDDVEQMARELLDRLAEVRERQARYTVVAQIAGGGDKIALGWYSTEKKALADALSLAYSTQTHEEHQVWIVPVWHETPARYYRSRKEQAASLSLADVSDREREVQRRQAWVTNHPGEPLPADWSVTVWSAKKRTCESCGGSGVTFVDE